MRKSCVVGLILGLLVSSAVRADAPAKVAEIRPLVSDGDMTAYKLAWHDEFDGATLNTEEWDYRTDSKGWSTQKPENVSLKDGKLILAV